VLYDILRLWYLKLLLFVCGTLTFCPLLVNYSMIDMVIVVELVDDFEIGCSLWMWWCYHRVMNVDWTK